MAKELFGEYLLRTDLIREKNLKKALDFQKTINMPIGRLAASMGYFPVLSVERVLKKQALNNRLFGELAVDMGLISRETLGELLEARRDRHTRIEEIFIECESLTREEMEEGLKRFHKERGDLEGETGQ